MLGMFIPIGIVIDVSEKVNKMIENKVPCGILPSTIISRFILPILYSRYFYFIDYLVYLKTG
jgi:hypothetical protein